MAASADEVPRLQGLYQRGQENGLSGLRLLSPEELHEIEPHAGGVAAIHVPQEGIADYPRVCEVLAREIDARGGEIKTGAGVSAILPEAGGWRVVHASGECACDWIVTCAGLQSDRVAALTGRPRSVRIVPFRGEYCLIRPERQFLVAQSDLSRPRSAVSLSRGAFHAHDSRRSRSRPQRRAGAGSRRISQGGYRAFPISPTASAFPACGDSCAVIRTRLGQSCGDPSVGSYSAAHSNAWCRRSGWTISCPAARAFARRPCRRMEHCWTTSASSKARARST